jgi:hypothetical protein
MDEKMYHGPELAELSEVVIGNTNVINPSENGLYFPNTKQIFINIETFKDY